MEERPDSFQRSMALLLGVVALVGILPFVVIYWWLGDLLKVAVDVGIMLGISLITGIAWFSRWTRIAVVALALFASAAAAAVPYLLGGAAVQWLYPIVMANHFLLSLRAATLVNIVIILGVAPASMALLPVMELISLLVTVLIVNLFTFIFSRRSASQRTRLDELASHDSLTRAGNRRLLDREMALAIARRSRRGAPSSLILLDLDHFKSINDTSGHEAGDRLLVELADIVRERIRETDRLFRYGGEEFVVLTPDIAAEQAGQLAEQLRERVRERLAPDRPMTASFGCAELGRGETPESWLRRADEALYRAKNAGRDRVELAGDEARTAAQVALGEVGNTRLDTGTPSGMNGHSAASHKSGDVRSGARTWKAIRSAGGRQVVAPTVGSLRMEERFQRTMALLLSGVAVFAILPFAVIRLLRGEPLLAAMDTGIAVSIALLAGYAWFGRSTQRALAGLALFCSLAMVALPYILGQTAVYWLYPVVVANYFMLPLRAATLINLLLPMGILPMGLALMPVVNFSSLVMTLLVVNLFAFVFSHRTASQSGRLDELASRDPLTHAGNRRLLDREMALAAARHSRYGEPSSLILLDLDYFKSINDTFGHEAGDRLLVGLADIVRGRIRETDQLFRYGGEEFVVLTPDTPAAQAEQLAERLRELVRERLAPDRALTASFGCAELRGGETPKSWLRRADAALYRAKHAGRDRVELAAEDLPADSSSRQCSPDSL